MKQLLIAFIAVILISCNNEKTEFENAKKINTVEAYRMFLNKNNNGIYADSAKANIKKIEKAEFDNLKFVNKIEEYEKYLLEHPNSMFIDTIKNIIYEKKYKAIINKGNIKLLEDYVKKYPKSPFIDDCNKKISNLKYQTSDKGIKKNVLSLIKGNCKKKLTKVYVKNGNVKISMNCIEVSRECISNSSLISAVLRGRRKCRNSLFTLKKRVQKLPGVKYVEVNDTSE